MLEPDVADALRRMGTALAAAPAFTVRMRAQREGRLPNDQVVLLGATSDVLARRPDRLAARVGSDLGSFSLWYDGAAVTVWNPTQDPHSRRAGHRSASTTASMRPASDPETCAA